MHTLIGRNLIPLVQLSGQMQREKEILRTWEEEFCPSAWILVAFCIFHFVASVKY